VTELARKALGDPTAVVLDWSIQPVGHTFGTPTTVGAVRIKGDGWSVFVKVIQSVRHWPLIDSLPEEAREAAKASPLWRYEADVYATDLTDALPEGLRLPAVLRIADLGDDRIAMVLEDVPTLDVVWDKARFAHAAELLGRMSVSLTERDALPVQSRIPAGTLRIFYDMYLRPVLLPAFLSDAVWEHPLLADRSLRADLTELADRIPSILDRLAQLPQVMVHGDASPQNLLVPRDAPDTFVAIDWSLGGIAPAGEDLAQLHLGLAHAGELRVDELPALHGTLVESYGAGAEEFATADIAYALAGGLLIRSAFTCLPIDRLGEPITDELAATFKTRTDLTRYVVDRCLTLTH
jgi:hypothetical protein